MFDFCTLLSGCFNLNFSNERKSGAMTNSNYTLLIGDPSYSSWSLRGWLAFSLGNIPVNLRITRFYQPGFAEDLEPFYPAKTVPAVLCSDGSVWTDSLAIIEELATRHPQSGLLPDNPRDRATARSLMAEMHSGFMALRSECPMNTRTAYTETPFSAEVKKDLDRLERLWSARSGKWLFGPYSAADAYFAPVAARIAGYSLPVSDQAQAYVDAHLDSIYFRQFRALGLTFDQQITYVRDFPEKPWPGPAPLKAKATNRTDSVNKVCPYSGKAVHEFLEFNGKIYGFCNPRCRDKTVIDPEAWPAFMALTV